MHARFAALIAILLLTSAAQAQVQSGAPADKAAAQQVSDALAKAGIDPRTTSVRVITTADRTVYLSGLISNAQTVRLAASAAAKAAPSYRIVNAIRSSFFASPNHVSADKTK